MGNWRAAGVFILFITLVRSTSTSPVVQTGSDCSQRNAATIASYERTAQQNSQSFLSQLALASCYDNAWRFQDVEPALVRAIEVLVVEFGNWIPKPAVPPIAGEDVPAPRRIRDKAPDYPENALANGVSGFVILELRISDKGDVKAARAVKTIPELDEAAIKAARSWKFAPTTVDGKPTEVLGYAAVRFGQTPEHIPADYMEMAAFYYQRGLFRLVRSALESALTKSRGDRERFGAWVQMNSRPTGAFTSPVKVAHVAPKYPAQALSDRSEGRVMIEALLDTRGTIGRARIVSKPSIFDAAAIEAILQWRFTPATRDGVPVATSLMTYVDFRVH